MIRLIHIAHNTRHIPPLPARKWMRDYKRFVGNFFVCWYNFTDFHIIFSLLYFLKPKISISPTRHLPIHPAIQDMVCVKTPKVISILFAAASPSIFVWENPVTIRNKEIICPIFPDCVSEYFI